MIDIQKTGWGGIWLPDFKIAMDGNHADAEFLFISHAHADHFPRNSKCKTFASAPTAELIKIRGFKSDVEVFEYESPQQIGQVRVTLYPAGHILGSAMIYIESEKGSLLYTGDYRTPPSPASEGFSLPDSADYFITEATFSLPVYKWKSHDELSEEIRSFAIESLNSGFTPVFIGYNLGKAQELMHMLAPLGLPVQIHKAGFELCPVYERFGIELGNYTAYDRDSCEGKILIAPSSAVSNGFASNIQKKKIAYCSGWASLESRQTQLNADKLIPISDHIDFFELIEVCKKLRPLKTFITHTPNPKVIQHYLDGLGLKSEALQFEDRHQED